jgi:hypothetical protein
MQYSLSGLEIFTIAKPPLFRLGFFTFYRYIGLKIKLQ